MQIASVCISRRLVIAGTCIMLLRIPLVLRISGWQIKDFEISEGCKEGPWNGLNGIVVVACWVEIEK
jgi:hypothetical protein